MTSRGVSAVDFEASGLQSRRLLAASAVVRSRRLALWQLTCLRAPRALMHTLCAEMQCEK